MNFGYARVGTIDQDLEKQIKQLTQAGCERIGVEKLLDQLRPNDSITICDLTRLSRSTKNLFRLVDIVEAKGANIKSLK